MSGGGLVDMMAPEGIGEKFESQENQVWFGPEVMQYRDPLGHLVSTTVDAGNDPTSNLRGGLVLGKVTASGLYTQYDPTLTNGAQIACAILERPVSMLGAAGAAANRRGHILIRGWLKGAALIGLDSLARQQLAAQFVFDDQLGGAGYGAFFYPKKIVAAGPTLTLTAADNFAEIICTAACTITLPAIGKGYDFLIRQQANANTVVSSAEGENVMVINNASADGVSFVTASNLIGAQVNLRSNHLGTLWLPTNLSPCTMTVVDA